MAGVTHRFVELSGLSEGRLREIFQQRRDDGTFLEALNEELKGRDSDEALELQLEVVTARRGLARAAKPSEAAPTPVPTGPVRDWLRAFLGSRNLNSPDERPLYRYRMADSEYEKAKSVLHHLARSSRLANPDPRAGAMFVVFCAEWFRRESDSTFLKWDNLAPDLFPSVPYHSKQELTVHGLDYWRRRLRKSEHAREFLLTLALEGGFPVRILREGARGWLKDYLRTVMRRAIAARVDSRDEILLIGEEERGRIRKMYQHNDFVALCSELVESLLHLRQMAEVESAGGIRNSALLDAKRPGWREELPIYVPAGDEALVAELLTGLIDEKMTGLSTAGVETRRYLVKRDGQWLSAVQLLADGEIPASKLPYLATQGRVRAVPSGELGNHLTGELALLEPPVSEQSRWRVRPLTRTAKLLTGFRLTSPVTTTLSSPGGVSCSWTWPHGEALRSDMLVFQMDEGWTADQPLLRFLRAGSVSSPAKTLYALVPENWLVEPSEESAIAAIESVPALARKLVALTRTAYFRSGEADTARFRIEPDTEARTRELELGSFSGVGITLAHEQCELVATPATPMIREAGKQVRSPKAGELFVRQPGGRWAPLVGPLAHAGLVELSWRDPAAEVQIEKRLLALVPVGAGISGSMKDALNGEIRLEGLPGWTASPRDASISVEGDTASRLTIRFPAHPRYHVVLALRPPRGVPFDVVVPIIGRDAVIALANGSILAQRALVDVGTLRGAIAIAPHRMVIQLAAKGARSGGFRTIVDGELPLGILRAGIEETLATLPGQDDLVELDFVGDTRPPIRISRYRHDQLSVDGSIVGWAPGNVLSISPAVKMILDPRHEHALEPTTPGLWRIPERCKGLCLVYLRDGADVVSRPVPVPMPGSPDIYSGELISALSIPEYEKRQHEIAEALFRIGNGEEGSGDLNWLLDLAVNLNGLPASAFDALKLLPSKPSAFIRVLLSARDAGERVGIWSLQSELPFLWLGLPLLAWRTALQTDYTAFIGALEKFLGADKAAIEALARATRLRSELIELEPALETTFVLLGMPVQQPTILPPLRELVSAYVARQDGRGGEAPNDLGERLVSAGLKLPPEIEAMSHTYFAGLFAPVVLAASAQEKLQMDRDLALLARRTLREDPIYVSASWSHLVRFYGLL